MNSMMAKEATFLYPVTSFLNITNRAYENQRVERADWRLERGRRQSRACILSFHTAILYMIPDSGFVLQ